MGPIYYPHPVTFGFHVSYSPYGGWGFGFSWGTPYMSFGIHFGGYGGYYPPYGYRPGGCYNCDINIGNDIDIGNGRGDRGDRVDHHRRDNVYHQAGVSDRMADGEPATPRAHRFGTGAPASEQQCLRRP